MIKGMDVKGSDAFFKRTLGSNQDTEKGTFDRQVAQENKVGCPFLYSQKRRGLKLA
jgi:hypothetical protein